MSSSTVATIFTNGVNDLWGYIQGVLPIVIPVLIGLAFVYGVYHFFRGRKSGI